MRQLVIICPDCGESLETPLSEIMSSMGGFNCKCGTQIEFTVYGRAAQRVEFIGTMKERLRNARRDQ